MLLLQPGQNPPKLYNLRKKLSNLGAQNTSKIDCRSLNLRYAFLNHLFFKAEVKLTLIEKIEGRGRDSNPRRGLHRAIG